MTPEQPEFIELSKSVKRIERVLCGDPLVGEKGMVHLHDQMAEDMYGVDRAGHPIEGKTNTVLQRLSSIEDNQKKAFWLFSGAVAVIAFVKMGVSAIWDKLFQR